MRITLESQPTLKLSANDLRKSTKAEAYYTALKYQPKKESEFDQEMPQSHTADFTQHREEEAST